MSEDDQGDDKPLPLEELIQERRRQHLDPVRAALVKMAGDNRNLLFPDQWEELVQLALECGVTREEAYIFLRKTIAENHVLLSVPEPIPGNPVQPVWSSTLPSAQADASPPAKLPAAIPQVEGSIPKLASSTLQARWCPQCSQPAAAQAQFCGKCALPLRCPRCSQDYQEGNRFCASCGLEPVKFRQFQAHIALGLRLLTSARGLAAVVERLGQAEQAEAALALAVDCFAEDQHAQVLLAEARRMVMALLWEAGNVARQEGHFSRAVQLLRRLAQNPAESARATAQVEQILAARESQLAEARSAGTEGNWKRAVRAMTALKQGFPEDPAINTLLADYQGKASYADEVVKNQIPALEETRRTVTLLNVLNDLKARQINVKGLAAYLEKFQNQVRRADDAAKAAAQLLKLGRIPEAGTEAEKALELAADHALALDVKRRVEEWNESQATWMTELDQALHSKQWILASVLLARLSKANSHFTIDKGRLAAVDAGLVAASNFLRFLAWVLLGAVFLILAGRVGPVLGHELTKSLPPRLLGIGLLSRDLLQPLANVASLELFAFLLLAFLLTCFRRPLRQEAIRGWLGVFSGSLVLIGVFLLGIVKNRESTDMPIAELGHLLCCILFGALVGGLYGYLTLTMTARLLPLPDGWFLSLRLRAVGAGVLGTWLCLAGLYYQGVLFKYLPVSVILFGLRSLAGVISHRSFYVLLMAALVAGCLERSILGPDTRNPSWSMWLVMSGIFTSAAFVMTPHRRFPQDLVWAALLTVTALALYQLLADDRGTTLLVSVWLFIAGTIAMRGFAEADQRLHFFDRCRLWWTGELPVPLAQVAVSPASTKRFFGPWR